MRKIPVRPFIALVVLTLSGCAIRFWTDASLLGLSTGAPYFHRIAATGNNASCLHLAVDSAGNAICVGYTYVDIAGPHLGSGDAFVYKVDPSGNKLWAYQVGTADDDRFIGVAVDADDFIYVGGHGGAGFYDTGLGNADMVVAKLTPGGSVVWSKQYGSSGVDDCTAIAVDSAKNVYCAGYSNGAFGEASGGGADVVAMKLDSAGDPIWTTQLGNTTILPSGSNAGNDVCLAAGLTPAGDFYCGGEASGALVKPNGGGGAPNDPFFIVFNPTTGAPLSAGQFNVVGRQDGKGVTVDPSGNFYLAGSAYTPFFEALGGTSDGFLIKSDPTGTAIWSHQYGMTTSIVGGGDNSTEDTFYSVTADAAGFIYATGHTYGNPVEANGGGSDELVIKWDSSGNVVWATQLGAVTAYASGQDGTFDSYADAIAVDAVGRVYVAGQTSSDGINYLPMILKLGADGKP